VELTVRVANGGAADVVEPVSVAVYGVDSTGNRQLLIRGMTQSSVEVDQYEDVSMRIVLTTQEAYTRYRMIVDIAGRWSECDEDNNVREFIGE
jgi:hypothetical protein